MFGKHLVLTKEVLSLLIYKHTHIYVCACVYTLYMYTYTWAVLGDGSHIWVSATHIGDLVEFWFADFNLVQPLIMQASGK